MQLARSTYYYRGRAERGRKTRRTSALRRYVPSSLVMATGASLVSFTSGGLIVNHKAVARLMRENGLQVRRCAMRTTDSNHDGFRSSPTWPRASALAPVRHGSAKCL